MIKGLFIKKPWIDLILSGNKTLEIRGNNSKQRGVIALIESGTGEIKGFIEIVDSFNLSPDQFECYSDEHKIPKELFSKEKMPYKKTYAWKLINPIKLKEPLKFKHKKGCVIWINLKEEHILKKYKSIYKN